MSQPADAGSEAEPGVVESEQDQAEPAELALDASAPAEPAAADAVEAADAAGDAEGEEGDEAEPGDPPAESLDGLAARLEAAIFAAGGAGLTARLRRALKLSPGQIDALVERINASLSEQGRPYEIAAVAGGYQFRTRPEWSDWLAELQPERKLRLSPAALDTLAVVAYRQPITRAELEDLRSVDCDGVLRSLTDRRLVRIVGRRDAPGRPALYGTTPYFLEVFQLRALHELPALADVAAEVASEGTAIEHPAGEGGAIDALLHGDGAVGAAGEPGAAEITAAALQELGEQATERSADEELDGDDEGDAEFDDEAELEEHADEELLALSEEDAADDAFEDELGEEGGSGDAGSGDAGREDEVSDGESAEERDED